VDAEGKVPNELFLLYDTDLGLYDYQSGYVFDGGTERSTEQEPAGLNGQV
jgi:hypothetical protein